MTSTFYSSGSQFITRKGFLRLCGTGMLAALGISGPLFNTSFPIKDLLNIDLNRIDHYPSGLRLNDSLKPYQQGRVLNEFTDLYSQPSFGSERLKKYWRDSVLPITDITIGSSEESFNVVWYKIGDEGYIHSGEIQPVITMTNPEVIEIPKGGTAVEVTVPFTDAHWDPGSDKPVSYRFYYSTTYWAMETQRDIDGNLWYGVRDDKWDYMFYVLATHLRVIPGEELTAISRNVPAEQKRIEVHLPEQVMIAYEYDKPVFMARVATGAVFSNGDYSTPPGSYNTFHKRSSRHMARGNLAANGYDLPGVPWNSYITEEGIAFHGTYWHNNFGRPRSHGCINMTSQAAKWVYLWTMPVVPSDQEWIYKDYGTSVDIIG